MEVKSVGTFPVILLKLATPPLPPQTKLNLEKNGWNWVLVFGHNIARRSGGNDGMNPKPNKKLSLEAESYGTIAWKGFFTQSQVLLSSIVVLKTEKGNYLNTNFTKLKNLYWSTLPYPLKLSKKFKFYHWYYLRFYFLFLLLPIISTWRCPTRSLLLLWTLYTNELNVF